MGSSAKFHDDGRARSWTLHGHGNKRINEQPISMMMAELVLGLSMILGRKAALLATPCKKELTSGWSPSSDDSNDGRAPS